MTSHRSRFTFLLLMCVVLGCGKRVDLEAEATTLIDKRLKLQKTLMAENGMRVAEFFTAEGAVNFIGGSHYAGPEAIADWVQTLQADTLEFKVTISSQELVMQPGGEEGVDRGYLIFEWQEPDGGASVRSQKGDFRIEWRRPTDGDWRIAELQIEPETAS